MAVNRENCQNLKTKIMKDTKQGFYDLPKDEACRDAEHNPPTHLYIPPGKGYRHICPSCGKVTNITPLQITL